SRFLVLRVEGAGEEPAVAPEADDHRVALGADLVRGLGREVAPARRLPDLVDPISQRWVERLEHRDPEALAPSDLVELLFHASRRARRPRPAEPAPEAPEATAEPISET